MEEEKKKNLRELEEVKEKQIIPNKEEAKKVGLNSVPTKTKIAAWWMIIMGLLFGLFPLLELIFFRSAFYFVRIVYPFLLGWPFLPTPASALIELLIFAAILFSWSLFFIAGLSIFKKRRWAWWACFIFLAPINLWSLYLLFDFYSLGHFDLIRLLSCFLSFIPLILLLSDRKNFWEITT